MKILAELRSRELLGIKIENKLPKHEQLPSLPSSFLVVPSHGEQRVSDTKVYAFESHLRLLSEIIYANFLQLRSFEIWGGTSFMRNIVLEAMENRIFLSRTKN